MRFGAFEFDAANGVLMRDGVSVALSHRAINLLELLLTRPGETVGKAELMDAGWPGAIVEESNLTVQIAALRKALGTTPEGSEWITTVPRLGYRFVARRDDPPAPAADDRPSIAVLPFTNLSSDPEQEYFAAGLAEDLITDLSKVPGLAVIARNSSFAYKDKSTETEAIARDLGVKYLVRGSVRRAADKVRINAWLIDTAEESPIWADRFDGDLVDVFALQDQVVQRVIKALPEVFPNMPVPKPRRHTSLEAYDLFSRGRTLVLESPVAFREGFPLLQRAVEMDPGFAQGHAWIAMAHIHAWFNWGLPESEHREQAMAAARKAVSLDADDADAHGLLGYVLASLGQTGEAMAETDLAVRLSPNSADVLALSSEALVHCGFPERGIAAAKRAFELNPLAPAWYYWIRGFAELAAGQYAEVVETLSHPLAVNTGSQRIRASALAQLGRLEEARAVARHYLEIVPNFRIRDWIASQYFVSDEFRGRFVDGYRLAGLPD